MIAQIGVRKRFGTAGVITVTVAGISPDLDTAAKLFGDVHFWRLHHAVGHSLLSVTVLSAVIAAIACRLANRLRFRPLFGWCLVATLVHCLTDSLYWWGVKPLWPFNEWEACFKLLEYLDLFVLAVWFGGAACLWEWNRSGQRTAVSTLALFAAYCVVRFLLPVPTGIWKSITGGWMYELPSDTVFDWW